MSDRKSREHAEHNARLCIHLLEQDDWYDWVVTTAFYASLHFVDDALFPLEKEGHVFDTLDAFAESGYARDIGNTQHKIRSGLVYAHLHNAYQAFKWLSDKCRTGRYTDYQIQREFAEQAKTYLAVVKQECDSRILKLASDSKRIKE